MCYTVPCHKLDVFLSLLPLEAIVSTQIPDKVGNQYHVDAQNVRLADTIGSTDVLSVPAIENNGRTSESTNQVAAHGFLAHLQAFFVPFFAAFFAVFFAAFFAAFFTVFFAAFLAAFFAAFFGIITLLEIEGLRTKHKQ